MLVQLATGKEVRQLVAPPEAEAEHQGVDGRHVEGPPQQVQDAYGFSFEVTPAQAAILERCRSKQEQQLAKWQQYQRDEGLAPPPDTLKRLCRKVRRGGRCSGVGHLLSVCSLLCLCSWPAGFTCPA